MDRTGIAADVAAAASVAVLMLTTVPYLALPTHVAASYYAAGIVGPQYFGIAAVVTAVALRSARTGRSDPATVAGVALAFGGVMALLAVVWGIAVPADFFLAPEVPGWLTVHRWLLTLAALTVPVFAGLYADAVLE